MADPLGFDHQGVLANVRGAETEDLLNRVTAYRAGMEPEAIDIIERELHGRGVTAAQIAEHAEKLGPALALRDGTQVPSSLAAVGNIEAAKCSFCRAPAIAQGWGWHWLFNKVPVFPRYLYFCREHAPRE
jgi:hypothetical protein